MPEKGALKKGYRCRILKMNSSKPLAYVSSALNACQAFDILFVCICRGIKEKEKDPRQKGIPIKRYGYPFRAGGLSSSVWLNFRFMFFGIDLEKDLCSLFHLSLSVGCRLIVCSGSQFRFLLFPVLSERIHRSGCGDAPSPYEPILQDSACIQP